MAWTSAWRVRAWEGLPPLVRQGCTSAAAAGGGAGEGRPAHSSRLPPRPPRRRCAWRALALLAMLLAPLGPSCSRRLFARHLLLLALHAAGHRRRELRGAPARWCRGCWRRRGGWRRRRHGGRVRPHSSWQCSLPFLCSLLLFHVLHSFATCFHYGALFWQVAALALGRSIAPLHPALLSASMTPIEQLQRSKTEVTASCTVLRCSQKHGEAAMRAAAAAAQAWPPLATPRQPAVCLSPPAFYGAYNRAVRFRWISSIRGASNKIVQSRNRGGGREGGGPREEGVMRWGRWEAPAPSAGAAGIVQSPTAV